MKKVLAAAFALLLSTRVYAQPIPIHDYPGGRFYASVAGSIADGARWPTLKAQQHWGPANVLAGTLFPAVPHPEMFAILDPTLGHVHVECDFPKGGEFADRKFVVPCTLMAQHLDGELWGFAGEEFESLVWADTGTDVPPIMIGDPFGLKQWKVSVTIDPRKWDNVDSPVAELNRVPLHGWADIKFYVQAYLNNGVKLDTTLWPSLFSVMDVSVPERQQPQQSSIPGNHVAAECTAFNSESNFGEMFVDLHGHIPVDAFSTKFTLPVLFYNYTGDPTKEFNGFFEQRLDPNLHMGVVGTILQHIAAGRNGHFGDDTPVFFDPATMGPGAHTVFLSWNSLFPPEATACIIAFTVNVDLNAPPPPVLCQDPAAPNVGQPLPCLPPIVVVPPPVCEDPNAPNFHGPLPCLPPVVVAPVFTPFAPFFEQLDGVFQVCNGPAGNPRLCKTIQD